MRTSHRLVLAIGLVLLASACTNQAQPGAPGAPAPSPEPPVPGSIDEVSGPIDDVTVAGIRTHLDALQEIADANDGTRAVGTSGYQGSADYVAAVLRAAGYTVELPTVSIPIFTQSAPTTLEEIEPTARSWTDGEDLRAMIYSASGRAEGRVTRIDGTGCVADDFAAFPAGDIVLLDRGPCFRRQQVEHAQDAGAVAVIATTPADSGSPLRPTLLFPEGIEVPVVAVTEEVSRALSAGPKVAVSVEATSPSREVPSVLGELAGGDPDHVVLLGGHLDSVMDGPGINDNGSGVALLLELARWLAGQQPAPTIRVGLWAGEEEGLYGSRDYVAGLTDDEIGDIDAYLNVDTVGSPNFAIYVYADRPDDPAAAAESRAITELLTGYFEGEGLTSEPSDLRGGSDHGPFLQVGVPVGGMYTGSIETMTRQQAEAYGGAAGVMHDACYHQACDTRENVNDAALGQAAGAYVHLLTELTLS